MVGNNEILSPTVPEKSQAKRFSKEALISWMGRMRFRLRKQISRKKAFIFSFLITYVLTVGLTVGSAVIQVDSADAAVSTTVKDDIATFVFYECENLNKTQFMAAKLLETLLPTSITFSGTILILQSDSSSKRGVTVWLFVIITLLVVGGIVLPTAKTIEFLIGYLWVLALLCTVSVFLSWCAFSDPSASDSFHKNEPCDGRVVF